MPGHGKAVIAATALALWITSAHAAPSVQVELRAAFAAPPYLVELL
jgi:hypothetical protein